MNKNLYRVVFNAARALRMVVHEKAASGSGGGSGSDRISDFGSGGGSAGASACNGRGADAADACAATPVLRGASGASGASGVAGQAAWRTSKWPRAGAASVLWSLGVVGGVAGLGAFAGREAAAQIIADPSAPANQRPTVLGAPNGVPLVNIQAPSAAGVSRNTYRQFDVDRQGVILNNSPGNVQTQQGGWVQGNPWLGHGPARIILNEVNSPNPSQLRGYVEVAGQRAEVIIANPSGIQVGGGGFINATRGTLTTGKPQFNNAGSLESFLVRGGTVSIDGAGLDATGTDYAAILAKAVKVNAGIWASQLRVVAGSGTRSADAADTSVAQAGAAGAADGASPATGDTPAGDIPTYALDVAAVGGMYAGHIVLVGTDAGLGVRNAGTIGAGAGELVITSGGRLENSGTLEAARLQLASVDVLHNTGTLRQTGAAPLQIAAPSLRSNAGGYIGAPPVASGGGEAGEGGETGGSGSGGTGGTDGGSNGGTGGGTDGGTDGGATGDNQGSGANPAPAPLPAPPAPTTPGSIVATGGVHNEGGRIEAAAVELDTPRIDNSGGTLSVGSLQASGPQFSNAGGTLNVTGQFGAQVGQFDNTGGRINAGVLDIRVDDALANRDGTLVSGANALLDAGGLLDNTGGIIQAGADLQINAASVVNAPGDRTSSTSSTSTANAGSDPAAATDGAEQPPGGSIRAERDATVTATVSVANDGTITAGRHVALDAAGYQGGAASTLGAGIQPDGRLNPDGGDLRATTRDGLQAHGTQLAAGSLSLQGARLDLDGSTTQGANVTLAATQGAASTQDATVRADGILRLDAQGPGATGLDNRRGVLEAQRLQLDAAHIDNTDGRIAQGGPQALAITTGRLTNQRGELVQAGALSVQAARIDNDEGVIASNADALSVDSAAAISNLGGTIGSQGATAVNAGGALDNTDGRIVGQQLAVTAGGELVNRGGTLAGDDDATVAAQGRLDNTEGTLAGQQQLQVRAGELLNTGGRIESTAGDARLDVAGSLDNASGSLSAARDLEVNSGALGVGAGGLVIAGRDARLDVDGQLNASGDARLRAGNVLAIDAENLQAGADSELAAGIARDGTVNPDGQLRIDSTADTRAHGRLLSGGQASIQADALNLQGAHASAAGLQLTARRGDIDTRSATLASSAGLQVRANTQSAQALDNRGGQLLADHIDIAAGRIDNRAGGLIQQSGAAQAASVTASQALNNDDGTIAANGALDIASGSFSNVGGTAASVGGDLALTVTGAADNSGGTLQAGQTLTLASASLSNRDGGRIVAAQADIDTREGALDNQGGIIATQAQATAVPHAQGGALRIDSGALNNDAGLIQAQGDLALDTHGQALTNTRSTLAQSGGAAAGQAPSGIVSGGDIALATGALGNIGGAILADGAVNAQAASATNQGGMLLGGTRLALDTRGGDIDNRGGRLLSLGALQLQVGRLDNSAGQVQANGDAAVNAQTVVNRNITSPNLGIAANNLAIDADVLDNTGGAVTANADARLNLRQRLDNGGGGQVQAVGNLAIAAAEAGSTLGTPGTPGTPGASQTRGELQVNNTGGTLVANGALSLAADRFSGDGTVNAGGDLRIALTQDVNQTRDIASGGALRYSTEGRLTNNAKITAGGDLGVRAANVDNTATGELSGANTAVSASAGTVNNQGLIDSVGTTRIDAASVVNEGEGRIYGDRVVIATQTLRNAGRDVNGQQRAGTIASRTGDVDIAAAQNLDNLDGAIISAGQDLRIGGAIDDTSGQASGRAQRVGNAGSTIESAGNMRIGAERLDNLNVGFATGSQTTSEARNETYRSINSVTEWWFRQDELGWCYQCASDRNDSGYIGQYRLEPVRPSDQYRFEDGYQRHPYDVSANARYGADNPVWGLFEVDYGDYGALLPKLSAYNQDFMARATRGYVDINVNRADITETVVTDPGRPGVIRSGGDLTLDIGSGSNTNSQVLAGATLGGNADALVNTEAPGERRTVEYGTWKKKIVRYKDYRVVDDSSGTTERPRTESFDLSIARKESNQGGGRTLNAPESADTAEGGGTVTASAQVQPATRSGAIVEVPAKATPADTAPTGAAPAAGTAVDAILETDTAPTTPPPTPKPIVVRTTAPDSTVPAASLFNTTPSGSHLIETDPRFASYRQWLSSDYLLEQLGHDPASVQKRLGDGYYEQRLIREQVAKLTGYRYLQGYSSDEDEYIALMNNGAIFAKQYNLRPGVALTPEQMAQLTSDIVWLVEQTVTLPDGNVQKVLAPQVYVRVKDGDIDGNGALLAGANVDLNLKAGELKNQGGTVAGRDVLRIDAKSIANLDGGRISATDVAVHADEDITVKGARIDASRSLSARAGRDLNVETTLVDDAARSGSYSYESTRIDRVAGLYVTGDEGTLVATAGQDVNLKGSVVANEGQRGIVSVSAERDVNLGTVTTRESANHNGQAENSSTRTTSQEVGSRIQGNGWVNLQAGNDFKARQVQVDAGSGLLTVHANRNLDIEAGRNIEDSQSRTRSTSSNAFNLSKKTTQTSSSSHSDLSQSSRFNGGVVSITAGGNLTGEGVKINGEQGVIVEAGNVLDLHEARDIRTSDQTIQTRKRSLSGGSFGGVLLPGSKGSRDTLHQESDTANVTRITSASGNVVLRGGLSQLDAAASTLANAISGQASGAQTEPAASAPAQTDNAQAQEDGAVPQGGVALRGVDVQAGGDVIVRGPAVSITGALDSSYSRAEHYTKGGQSNVITGWHDLGKGQNAKNTDTHEESGTTLVRSRLDGANVTVQATDANDKRGALSLSGTAVNAPGTLKLEGDVVNFGVQQTLSMASDNSEGRDLLWQKSKNKGTVDATSHYNELNVGKLDLQANAVTAEMGARDSVQALSKQPGMEWIGQLQSDPELAPKVDWKQVEEAHEQWDYKQQGLTPEGAAIVTAVVTYFTWGAASGVGQSAAAAAGQTTVTAAGVTTLTAAGTVIQGAVAAGLTALSSQTAVSLINNKGNLKKTFKDLGSKDSVKSLVTAIVTGGVLGGLNLNPTGLPTESGGAQTFLKQLGQNVKAGAARALVDTAINGGSLEDRLKDGLIASFLDTAAAQGAYEIGDLSVGSEPLFNTFTNKVAHLIAGCAAGAARTGNSEGCAAGGLGAVVGESAAEIYGNSADTVQFAAMFATLAAGIAGLDADQVQLAGNAGANAAANNYLSHAEQIARDKARDACYSGDDAACGQLARINNLDKSRDGRIRQLAADCDSEQCAAVIAYINEELTKLNCISGPYACDDRTLRQAWSAAQEKAQALPVGFGPDDALLMAYGLAKGVIRVGVSLSDSGPVPFLADGLATGPATYARQINNLYRDGGSPELIQQTVRKAALSSTHNGAADEVVLGKHLAGSKESYEVVAQSRGATYFSMPDWSTVRQQMNFSNENMWLINREFLDQQIVRGKTFLFTSDPRLVSPISFTYKEYNYLRQVGFFLEKTPEGMYRAIKR